ncbi:hypothetical protein MHBO_000874 [Bonamia ostreae]|uniref:GYF domain-containing protein n=1 Tax=Bonamia ostreae TaxID=126728 RepID=A0ABV2AH43_9EUKA
MSSFSEENDFEPFNLNEEREDSESDPWLDELSEMGSKAVHNRSKDIPIKEVKERPLTNSEVATIREKIASKMEEYERVNSYLARLSKFGSKTQLEDLMSDLDTVSIKYGDLEVYNRTREEMLEKAIKEKELDKKEKKPNQPKENSNKQIEIANEMPETPNSKYLEKIASELSLDDKVWEFEWIGDFSSTVEGPFSMKQLEEWNSKGSFSVKPIRIRRKNRKEWLHSENINRLVEICREK